MNTETNAASYPTSFADSDLHPASQGLLANLFVVTHYVQKQTLETLSQREGYQKLSLNFQGYLSLLAECNQTPGDLAQKLAVSKQACSKTIRELEQLQLVRRQPNPDDSRSSLLSPTEQGWQLIEDGIDASNAIHRQFEQLVGANKLQQVTATLRGLCQSLAIDLPQLQNHGRIEPSEFNRLLPAVTAYLRAHLQSDLERKGFDQLKPSYGQVMGMISREPRHIQYIARVLGLSKQAIAASAAELEQAGFVERVADERDRRQIIVRLAPLGKRLLAESIASVNDLQKEIKKQLSEADYQQLDQLLSRLYLQVADEFDSANLLRERIQELSKFVLQELGATGANALAQHLINLTRGKI